jgi:predicted Zn-dependent peptidase
MKIADFDVFEPAKGFRVLVHPTTKFKTVSLALYVHQPLGDGATPLALLPFVLRRGCQGTPDLRSIVVFLEDLYGASFGVDVAKIGERQLLALRMETVNDRFAPTRVKTLEKSLGFLWRVLSRPVGKKDQLRADFVAQEKENLKRLIDGMINDRMSYAYERCIQEMCAGERYARYEYGRVEEVDGVTPKELFKLHKRLLAEAPMDLFVIGDLEPKKVAALAKRVFRFGKRAVKAPPPTEVRDGAGALRERIEKLEVDQGKVVLGCRTGVTWGHPDAFPLLVYNGLLGAFPHSKLFANVREREGLAYAVHSSVDAVKGLLFVTAGIDPDKYAKCVEVIREQMADVAAGRWSDDEWGKTLSTLLDRVRSREDSPSGKIHSFLEMEPSTPPLTPAQAGAALAKVTREDVLRAAARVKPDTIYYVTRP